jgi:hypothetical protein
MGGEGIRKRAGRRRVDVAGWMEEEEGRETRSNSRRERQHSSNGSGVDGGMDCDQTDQ